MNDQKQKIKPIYKVMIFTIVLTFVLALTVVPAFADEPQVTNLIGTTWRLGDQSLSDLNLAVGDYFVITGVGSYNITSGGEIVVSYVDLLVEGFAAINDYSLAAFGYADGQFATLPLGEVENGQGEIGVCVLEFTITGGEDISDPIFVDLINTYGTLVSDGEEVTTPTIYDIWDDILQWMVNAAENMTAAFYYNEQLTLLGILCVIPLSFGLVILIIKIFEEWIALR